MLWYCRTQRELVHHVAGFIGLSAPYHIADHYQFESDRVVGPINGEKCFCTSSRPPPSCCQANASRVSPLGVHEISSMKPAMLGESNFDRLSPTALLEDAARQGTVSRCLA